MNNKLRNTSISLRTETYDLLQSIKSCFQLKNRKSITYDEIIRNFVMAGIDAKEPQLSQILNLIDNSIATPPAESETKETDIEVELETDDSDEQDSTE